MLSCEEHTDKNEIFKNFEFLEELSLDFWPLSPYCEAETPKPRSKMLTQTQTNIRFAHFSEERLKMTRMLECSLADWKA